MLCTKLVRCMHMYGHTNLIALYYFDTDTFYYVSRTNYW